LGRSTDQPDNAVRPNSVTRATTVSFHAAPMFDSMAAMAPSRAPRRFDSRPLTAPSLTCVSQPVEGERADARPLRHGKELRSCCRGFGEMGAHLIYVSDLDDRASRRINLPAVRIRARDRFEVDALFEHARERRIGVAIDVEQAPRGFVAHRGQSWRNPRQDRCGTEHHQRRDRSDRE
jgi:sugar phosphate isomerase/epimerase